MKGTVIKVSKDADKEVASTGTARWRGSRDKKIASKRWP